MDRDEVKKDIDGALQDILRHLERRETEGLFSSEEKTESVRKFVEVAESIAEYLEDPSCEEHNGPPLESSAAAVALFACRVDPDLLPYCRLLQYRVQRRNIGRNEKS